MSGGEERRNSSDKILELYELLMCDEDDLPIDSRRVFEIILDLFAHNFDLMSPLIHVDENHSRNILQLLIDCLDDNESLFMVEFFVQNRDYPKK